MDAMEREQKQAELSMFLCSECGEPRINTTSGSVCHNGHGKIHPHLSPGVNRVCIAIMRGDPPANYNRKLRCWEIKGSATAMRKAKKHERSKSILAHSGLSLVRLIPLTPVEKMHKRFGYHRERPRNETKSSQPAKQEASSSERAGF